MSTYCQLEAKEHILKWSFISNSYVFNGESAFENVFCKMSDILSQCHCVNSCQRHGNKFCKTQSIVLKFTILIQRVHDDVIKRKHFPRYWPFVMGLHWWPVDSPNKCQWREALMFSLIYVWTNGWANHRDSDTCDLRCHRAHYGVIAGYVSLKTLLVTKCVQNKEGVSSTITWLLFGISHDVNTITTMRNDTAVSSLYLKGW